jgi:uncharacterized protein
LYQGGLRHKVFGRDGIIWIPRPPHGRYNPPLLSHCVESGMDVCAKALGRPVVRVMRALGWLTLMIACVSAGHNAWAGDEPATWLTAEKLKRLHPPSRLSAEGDLLTATLPRTSVSRHPFYGSVEAYSPLPPRRKPGEVMPLLGHAIPPQVAARLMWVPSQFFSGLDVKTPVLVVRGAHEGPTLCLTAAVHGDELNGIEMVRQVLFGLNPAKLRGTVIGVPIVNMMGFARNSRYLPDRRDLNRYFPGNPNGSLASRFAWAFFNDLVRHCDALVDIHTGSFHRTNYLQVRADLSQAPVQELARSFGEVVVLNSLGNSRSLRTAAVMQGIPAVTLEAGEPLRLQKSVVREGVGAIMTLLKKRDMIEHSAFWREPAPAIYASTWVRAQSSGILFSQVKLGAKVEKGDILGTVTNPVSGEKTRILASHAGKVIGMALDQFVLPGFAAYHLGILPVPPPDPLPPPLPAPTPATEDDGLED